MQAEVSDPCELRVVTVVPVSRRSFHGLRRAASSYLPTTYPPAHHPPAHLPTYPLACLLLTYPT